MKYVGMHCYVSGNVQGVWFRASTKQQAERLAIGGLVRNLDDGRVEVFAYGREDQLEMLYTWLKQGPPLASVSECTREELPWEDYSGFDIL